MRTIYYTEDGKKFSTKEAAELHEQELEAEKSVDKENIMKQIEANNKKMYDICSARENLLDQIDKLTDKFDKLRDENEKLFKSYYGEEQYEDILKCFNEIMSGVFDRICEK